MLQTTIFDFRGLLQEVLWIKKSTNNIVRAGLHYFENPREQDKQRMKLFHHDLIF